MIYPEHCRAPDTRRSALQQRGEVVGSESSFPFHAPEDALCLGVLPGHLMSVLQPLPVEASDTATRLESPDPLLPSQSLYLEPPATF